MKKKILFIVFLASAICVGAQNFKLQELVNVLRTRDVGKAQEFLERRGLEFMVLGEWSTTEFFISYGYKPCQRTGRAEYFVNLFAEKGANNSVGRLSTIRVHLTSLEKFNEWRSTVRNLYKGELVRTHSDFNSGITNIYRVGNVFRFYFTTWRDVNSTNPTEYMVCIVRTN